MSIVATLLAVGSSDGERRCDAKCHDAQQPDCDCVCAGRYHGIGGQQAMDLIQQDVTDGRYGRELAHIARYLTDDATQPTLF